MNEFITVFSGLDKKTIHLVKIQNVQNIRFDEEAKIIIVDTNIKNSLGDFVFYKAEFDDEKYCKIKETYLRIFCIPEIQEYITF